MASISTCVILTGLLLRRKLRLAAGLDGGDVQFALNMSPGKYRSFSVCIIGPFFGRSRHNINLFKLVMKMSQETVIIRMMLRTS